MFKHVQRVGVDVSNEQPLRLRFHFDTHAKPVNIQSMRVAICRRAGDIKLVGTTCNKSDEVSVCLNVTR